MNELITNSQRMTSLEIAELSGKNHKDVMRAIRNMEDAWEKINGRNFALVEYISTSQPSSTTRREPNWCFAGNSWRKNVFSKEPYATCW